MTRMPCKGERVYFPPEMVGRKAGLTLTVDHVAGNLVWCIYPGGAILPFIGFFESDQTFNTLAEIVEEGT